MWTAFSLAVGDVFTPAGRRALFLSLGGTLALLAVLWLGAATLLTLVHASPFHGLDIVIEILGSLAALFIAWLLFPSLSILVLGIFLDPFVAAIERDRYPHLPPARRVGVSEFMRSGLRLALLAVVLNLALLPVYFVPVVNVAAYYAINGYLVGRTYFEAIALRRMELRDVRAMWHANRAYFSMAGAIIAFLLSLPFLDLIAPLIGAAFMLHLFENSRRRSAAKLVA